MKKVENSRITALILAIVFLVTFGGCSNLEAETSPSINNTEPSDDVLGSSDYSEPENTLGSSTYSEPKKSKSAEELLSEMSLEDKVAQLFIVRPEQLDKSENTTEYNGGSLQYNVGGVALFAKNIKNRSQCKELIDSLQNACNLPLFVTVDEEGGMVARLGNNPEMGTTKFPNMAEITTRQGAYNVGSVIGMEIKKLGFNLDFAPVADVNSNPDNPIIGVRSFGSDASHVAEQVSAVVEGFHSSGMLCTLKHFPGHGDTKTDSHLGYTQIDKTIEELRQTEFVPFKSGIASGVDFVMVGHISVPEVTQNDLPATLSPTMINILRNELNFDGLIITDSFEMGAISDRFTSSEAAVMSLQAGTDILLMPENLEDAINGVLEAIENGTLSVERIERSVLKILQKKIDSGII